MRSAAYESIDGTAARKINYDVYSSNSYLKQKKKARSYGKYKARLAISIFLIFLMGITLMYRYALATELNYRINSLNQEYMELLDLNSVLRVEIEEKTDLDEIKRVAMKELDMCVPSRSQIIHVKVPGEDNTVVSEQYSDYSTKNTGKGTFAVLVDRISRFTRLLY